jgi:hypothetical protein
MLGLLDHKVMLDPLAHKVFKALQAQLDLKVK